MDSRALSELYYIFGLRVSAEDCGLPNRYADAAKRFVTSLTRERDGEDGPDFWAWMIEHLAANLLRPKSARRGRVAERSFYETLFLAERAGDEVVGTVSVVKDDRGRGAAYGIDGIWLGGLNLSPARRGAGLGTLLLDTAWAHVRTLAAGWPHPLRVNAFTRNPAVMGMLERRDFTRNNGMEFAPEDAGCSHYFHRL